jgi:hypothetical protein
MENPEMIPVSEFCHHYNIEVSFIHTLEQTGLVEISKSEETAYIPVDQLASLERILRLY